jgi:hypothetical protein
METEHAQNGHTVQREDHLGAVWFVTITILRDTDL